MTLETYPSYRHKHKKTLEKYCSGQFTKESPCPPAKVL
jgi:hypothetical protein